MARKLNTPKLDENIVKCLKDNKVLAKNLLRHLDPGGTITAGNIDNLVQREKYRLAVKARSQAVALDNWAAVTPQFMDNVDKLGAKRAVSALLVHDKGDAAGMASAESLARGYLNLVTSRLDQVAETFSPNITGGTRNMDILRDTVRVLQGGSAKLDKSLDLATAMREALDTMLKLYREAGGVINHIDNYYPQNHDLQRLSKVGRDQWKNDIRPALNRARMVDDAGQPLTDDALEELLDYVYASVTTQGASKHRTPPDFAVGQFGSGMAGRHAMHRVLHFYTPDEAAQRGVLDGLSYHDKYGKGDLWSNFTSHLNALATDAALLKNGLNSNEKVASLTKWADQAQPSFNWVSIDAVWKNLQGFDNNIDNAAVRTLDDVRNVASSAFMGNVLWASLPDIVTNAMNRALNDMGISSMLSRFFAFDNPAERAALVRAGGGIDAFISTLGAGLRWEDPMGSGLARRLSDANYRLGGATAWMNRQQHTWSADFMGNLAQYRNTDFDSLPKGVQSFFRTYGLEDDWNVIRTAPIESPNGFDMLNVTNLDDADLAARVLGAIGTERNRAILEPDAKVRGAMNRGLSPADLVGQGLRAAGQFKSFAATFIINGIGRYVHSNRITGTDRYKYIFGMVTGMTLLGAVSMNIREILKGRDPIDPLENPAKFWAGAVAQGGSLPILADLVLEGRTRHGRTALEATFGATGSVAGDIIRTTVQLPFLAPGMTERERQRAFGEVSERMSFYVPFSSLWWSRVMVQRGLRDTILGLADPTYAAKMLERERNLKNRSGQGTWFGYDRDFGDRISPDRPPEL